MILSLIISNGGQAERKGGIKDHTNNDLLSSAYDEGTIRKEQPRCLAAILAVMEGGESVYEASPWRMSRLAETQFERIDLTYFPGCGWGANHWVCRHWDSHEAEVLQIAVKRAFQGQGTAQQFTHAVADQRAS